MTLTNTEISDSNIVSKGEKEKRMTKPKTGETNFFSFLLQAKNFKSFTKSCIQPKDSSQEERISNWGRREQFIATLKLGKLKTGKNLAVCVIIFDPQEWLAARKEFPKNLC